MKYTTLLAFIFIFPAYLISPVSVTAEEPLEKYRTGQIDPIVLSVPAEIRKGISEDPGRYAKALVDYLTGDTGDGYLKVKRIHDWITENVAYDNDRFFGRGKRGDALRDGRATCGGYAGIFRDLARLAGIETIVITGRSRETFDTKKNEMATHVWNAVRIDHSWHIVDTTHDSRFSYTDGKFGKKSIYRDTNLFISPEEKILSNFPDNPEQQFLSHPISLQDFLSFPMVHAERFVRSGLSFATDTKSLIQKERLPLNGNRYLKVRDTVHPGADLVSIRFRTPGEVSLHAKIEDANGKGYDSHALCYRENDLAVCSFSAPGKGDFDARISSRNSDEKQYNIAYSFHIISDGSGGPEIPLPFQLYVLDGGKRSGIAILDHNLNDRNADEYFIRMRHSKNRGIFSAVWDSHDEKLKSGTVMKEISDDGDSRVVEYRYAIPPAGTYYIKIRSKWANEKLFNETAAIARITRDSH